MPQLSADHSQMNKDFMIVMDLQSSPKNLKILQYLQDLRECHVSAGWIKNLLLSERILTLSIRAPKSKQSKHTPPLFRYLSLSLSILSLPPSLYLPDLEELLTPAVFWITSMSCEWETPDLPTHLYSKQSVSTLCSSRLPLHPSSTPLTSQSWIFNGLGLQVPFMKH